MIESTANTVPLPGQGRRVKVLLPLPLGKPYDYLVPAGMDLSPGDVVEVPLGPRQVTGVVWNDDGAEPDVDPARLKAVIAAHDPPFSMPPDMLRFADWVAAYYLVPQGAVLRMMIRRLDALKPPRPVTFYVRRPDADLPARMTPARKNVLAVLDDGMPRTAAELAEIAGVGTSVVKGLAELQVLRADTRPADPIPQNPDAEYAPPDLADAQADVAGRLVTAFDDAPKVILLEGVTGAGKTEVYFEAVAEALRRGRQALVLLPEIALTQQIRQRFADRFGASPVAWHYGLSDAERKRTWRQIVSGAARVIVGARSALFLPFTDLGLIVVDEEHDPSFKQEDGVRYHARDMAVLRGNIGKFPVVLVSATPSLESVANVEAGRYEHVQLPQRFGAAKLPDVSTIDLREDRLPRGRWISGPLAEAVEGALVDGEQALLFLNRRGYAPLTLCDTCGHRLKCPHCTAWLVEHRYLGRLQCHHCGYQVPVVRDCPSCGNAETMRACGPGVERLAEEVQARWPDARMALMTSDLIHSPTELDALIQAMVRGEIDVLIGTQIVAKGHNFPRLTLVGVIDSDLGLEGGDLRAAERTFQLLHQVAGRAGRADLPGRVMLQTYNPDHPVLQAMATADSSAFLSAELDGRRAAHMPPYGRLIALILSGPDENRVLEVSRSLAKKVPQSRDGGGPRVLGPAPAPLAVVRGRHRMRFLVQGARGPEIARFVQGWLAGVRLPNNMRLTVDVDPHNFL